MIMKYIILLFLYFITITSIYANENDESCNLKEEWILYKYMNNTDEVSYIWDGNCDNNDNAIGKGKLEIFVNNKKYYELLKINNDVINFCRDSKNFLICGIYANQIEWSGVFNKNLRTITSFRLKNDEIEVGEWTKYLLNEVQFFRGIIKKNLFFGKIKVIDKSTKNISTIYGSYDMISATLEGNVLIQNSSGYVSGYFRDGEMINKSYIINDYFRNMQIKILNSSKKIEKNILDSKRAFYNSVKIFKNDLIQYNPKNNKPKISQKGNSQGSGFVISSDGYIVTNYHVIKNFSNIEIILQNSKYIANIVKTDPQNDIAILKIDENNLPYLYLNNYVYVGEKIVVLGYPAASILGNNIKVTFGNINSLSGLQNDSRFIQIDAPIQPGNSGGPIVNYCGDVIGIATEKVNDIFFFKQSGQLPQNINYGLKINLLENMYNFNIKHSCNYKLDRKNLIDKVKKSIVMIIAY